MRLVCAYLYPCHCFYRVLWFVRQFASCLRDRRRDGETRHVRHYRNRDALCRRLILLLTRTDGMKATQGSVFPAGMQAVIAIFGIAWMGDTFLQGNMLQLTQSVEGVVRQMPWLFGIALFAMSILLYSQAATVRALMPLGIALGISPMILVALFPAVNGYFFIPNYPTVVAAINFDRTGTTRIGKYVLNHSFMLPGLVSTGVAIGLGLLFIRIF